MMAASCRIRALRYLLRSTSSRPPAPAVLISSRTPLYPSPALRPLQTRYQSLHTTPHRFFPGSTGSANSPTYFRPRTLFLSSFAFLLLGAGLTVMSTRSLVAYTDSESLSLFTPSTDDERTIDAAINAHPLTLSLRADPKYSESRPSLKFAEHFRALSLTSGVLAGPGRIVVPPYVWVSPATDEEQAELIQVAYLGPQLCGYPGLVHGGLLATLLDEGLARCAFEALPNRVAMTASLKVDYRKPSPAESYVVLKAKAKKVEGRKCWVEGRIEILPMKEGEEPIVLVEAEALMVEPRKAGLLTSLVGKSE